MLRFFRTKSPGVPFVFLFFMKELREPFLALPRGSHESNPMRRRSALRCDVLTVLLLCRVGRAQIPGRTFVDDMRRPVGELGEHAACPLDVLSEMQGRQISPRPPPGGAESHADAVPGEDGRGSMVPPRPDSFHSASSVIEHLPNGLIRKILPARSGEAEEDTQRRVLKEAELMATFYLYRNFPRVAHVDVRQRAIYMENCGKPLVQSNVPCDWRHQVLAILHVLQQHEVFHNDWLGLGWPATPNLTERDGILYLIDFSWATFGRDGYPFMNPSVDIVADASDMWQMFEKTRDQDEERRLRFQHALDKQALRSRLRSDPLWRDNPEIRVVRVIDRVGAKIQGQELHGARLTAAAISAEALRVLVSVSDVHPWCLAHCSDCSILLSLTNHSPSRDRWAASPCRHEEPLLQIRKSFCQCDLQVRPLFCVSCLGVLKEGD